MNLCPCGSTFEYSRCCGRFIVGGEKPDTPEQLMRSRSSAYGLLDIDYIERTMQGPARRKFNKEEAYHWAQQITWLGLEVKQASAHGDVGYVEFIAYYQHNQVNHQLRELSEFRLEDGQWFYVDGKMPGGAAKVGRNEVCPCGSLKKYKKCCGKP